MDAAYIYALVDPNTHIVRYVGQCKDLHVRYVGHRNSAEWSGSPVYEWIRGLSPAEPQLVLLEVIRRNRQVEVRPGRLRLLSSILEAKWLKRFRRSALNVNVRVCTAAFEDFANPPNLNPEYSTEE
jgi:hypothetical protein